MRKVFDYGKDAELDDPVITNDEPDGLVKIVLKDGSVEHHFFSQIKDHGWLESPVRSHITGDWLDTGQIEYCVRYPRGRTVYPKDAIRSVHIIYNSKPEQEGST